MNKKILTKNLKKKYTWLVTGVAGFVGSNLLETLLKYNQRVIGIDNFLTSTGENFDKVKNQVSKKQWANFTFFKQDLKNYKFCKKVCKKVDYVLHQAALGSVPRSIKNPLDTHQNNVDTFFNILLAAKNSKVKRFVYASSSSVYGDHKKLPKIESTIGKQMSTYALTKYINELYAEVFFKNYGFCSIGLRYFNVFGKYQNHQSSYAAVIPIWINQIIKGKKIVINGNGKTSRDFCFIENVVEANLLAALSKRKFNKNEIYNVAVGEKISLNRLYYLIKKYVRKYEIDYKKKPIFKKFRQGDILHSRADINKIAADLSYTPSHKFLSGLKILIDWSIKNNNA